MENIWSAVWGEIVGMGLPMIFLAIAVWWLNNRNREDSEARAEERRLFMEALERERGERIELLEQRAAACEAHRLALDQKYEKLHDQMVNMLQAQRDLRASIPPAHNA